LTTHHPAGQIQTQGDRATLVFERRYPHPQGAVWDAITSPAQLAQWYMAKATIEPRVGGRVEMWTGPSQFHVQGRILRWDPPRVFEHEWHVEPRAELPQGERATIRWELSPVEGGTLLRLTHQSLTKGTALGFAPGTHVLLERLDAQLAGGKMPDWMQRYGEVASLYPAWQRPG